MFSNCRLFTRRSDLPCMKTMEKLDSRPQKSAVGIQQGGTECKKCETVRNLVQPLKLTLEKHGLLQIVQKYFPKINVAATDNSMICDSCVISLLEMCDEVSEVNGSNDKLITDNSEILDIVNKDIIPAPAAVESTQINLGTIVFQNKYVKNEDSRLCNEKIKTEDLEIKEEMTLGNKIKTEDLDIKEELTLGVTLENVCDNTRWKEEEDIEKSPAVDIQHEKDPEKIQFDFDALYKSCVTVNGLRQQFQCQFCENAYVTKLALHNHILKTHPDNEHLITSKILTCEICDYRSLFKHSINKHLLVHMKGQLRTISCPNCDFVTNDKHSLSRHMWRHTQKKPFLCTLCLKDFIGRLNLDAHIVSKHSDNQDMLETVTRTIYDCKQCPYKCIRTGHFRRHMILAHKIRDLK